MQTGCRERNYVAQNMFELLPINRFRTLRNITCCATFDDLVLQGDNAKRSCSPIRLRDFNPQRWERSIRSAVHTVMECVQMHVQFLAVCLPGHPVNSGRRVRVQSMKSPSQDLHRDMVQKRREAFLRIPRGCLPYPVRRL